MEQLEIDEKDINPADPRDWDAVPAAPRRNLPRITFRSSKAIAYAQAYAAQQGSFCQAHTGHEHGSEAAHFLAHCLAAGGLRVEPKDENALVCKHGLTLQSADILAQLKEWSQKYANIRPIDLSDTIEGDIGFLQNDRPGHAFMISEPWNIFSNPFDTPKVWTHNETPGCHDMDAGFRQWLQAAYRLEDG